LIVKTNLYLCKEPTWGDVWLVFALCLLYIQVSGYAFPALGNKYANLLFPAGIALIPVAYVKLRGWTAREAFLAKRPSLLGMCGGLLLMAGIAALLYRLIPVVAPFLPVGGETQSAIDLRVADEELWYALAIMVVLPAVCEEILCRGFLLTALRGLLPEVAAIALSAGFFALLHLEPARIVFTFIAGVAISYAAAKTGSLVVPMAMHFAYNFFLFAVVRFGFGRAWLDSPWLWAAGVVLAAIGGFLLRLPRRRRV